MSYLCGLAIRPANTLIRSFYSFLYSGLQCSTSTLEVSCIHLLMADEENEDLLTVTFFLDFSTYYFGVRARALIGFLGK